MQAKRKRAMDDYCDAHLLEVLHDPGEADVDGRIKTADRDYATVLLIEELLVHPSFIERFGVDPRRVILTSAEKHRLALVLPEFAPFCCTIGKQARERVLRKARHPPVEVELARRALDRLEVPSDEAGTPSRLQ
jgi:hypothetical protein